MQIAWHPDHYSRPRRHSRDPPGLGFFEVGDAGGVRAKLPKARVDFAEFKQLTTDH